MKRNLKGGGMKSCANLTNAFSLNFRLFYCTPIRLNRRSFIQPHRFVMVHPKKINYPHVPSHLISARSHFRSFNTFLSQQAFFPSPFLLPLPPPSSAMSNSRTPALVRNVSLPVLQNSLPPHSRPVTRVSSFSTLVKPSLPTRRDFTDSEDDDGMVPQLPFRPCQHIFLHSDHHHPSTPPSSPTFQNHSHPVTPLQFLRNLVRTALASLSVFLPPDDIAPHQQLKLIFISAISLLLLLPATTLCYIFPDESNFRLLTLFLAAVPFIARTTASLFLSTAILVSLVLIFTFTASALISPVLLVWSSVVPVITFASLGNRCGVASSAITAATVAAADFSDQLYAANSRLVIASWLLFLGVIGVVQKQIRHVVIDHGYVPAPESSTVRRKEWHVDHDLLHEQDEQYYDHLTDQSDAEVPDSVLLRGRSF